MPNGSDGGLRKWRRDTLVSTLRHSWHGLLTTADSTGRFDSDTCHSQNLELQFIYLSREDISKLKILSRCLNETLRLYPVGSFVGRTLTSDMTFKNPYHPPQTITLDKGTSVAIHFYALHHHPDFWESPEVSLRESSYRLLFIKSFVVSASISNKWKRPKLLSHQVFDPDRFTLERSKGRSPFAYLPFSGGSR